MTVDLARADRLLWLRAKSIGRWHWKPEQQTDKAIDAWWERIEPRVKQQEAKRKAER